jgi:phage terminase large subunit
MVQFKRTTATEKILQLSKRIRAVQGGTSASKTISILMCLIDDAQTDTSPTISSVVSESMPHLRRGAMRDWQTIMESQSYFDDNRWDKTNSIYTCETGSKIEFFGADESEKVKGARRDRLFLNEANNIKFETFNQLEVRTKEYIFLDWNPTAEFWWDSDVKHWSDTEHIILTYRDNEGIDPRVRDSIERRKYNASWFRVYGDGLLGEIEGRIYKNWKIFDELPHEAQLIGYGLDFGYTNDPTSIVAIYYYNGGYIFHEIGFSRGLTNRLIADIFKMHPSAPIIADSAEPKSIAELREYGLTVIPATKGKGSVTQRIQFVQGLSCGVTKHSVNIIKEYRNYCWEVDKDGRSLNIPDHEYSHSMDAISYGMQIKRSVEPIKQYVQPDYESPSLR